jgi:hypothetical protein
MASANLGPVPVFTILDSNGNPVSGGKLYTYLAGTSTPQATYTDRTAATPNANPTIADSAGRVTLFFDDSIVYKLVAKDSSDVTLWTVDNYSTSPVIAKATTLTISGNGTIAGTLAVTGAITGSSTVQGTRLISTVATGTAPLTVTSTTPVSNLTTVPTTYNKLGTQNTNVHIVTGQDTLAAGTMTITLSGSAVFTSSSSYAVVATDATATNAVRVTLTSGSQFTLTGTGTDVISWIAIGN